MSYLVLHIDVEFIVGTVCADNGNSYPINNGNEDLLWLYFFNNPHHNRISFGKENKIHFNDKEINYYGRFFDLIENDQNTFAIRGIQKKAIELLEYSGLVKTLKEAYSSITRDTPVETPTLITFSNSIGELAKQKTTEYLKSQGFKIDSYTIPLSELACYYPYSRKEFMPANGNIILLLAATNTSLHLKKLLFSDNYFMLDSEVKTYRGRGIDPRKRALVRFVVNEINNAVGALSSNDEKELECERLESKADSWLKRIDAQLQNRPYRIVENLSKMPSAKKEVFVRRDYIDSDTGHYIQELMDIFEAYKSDNVSGDVTAIFLVGDCFQNSLVKARFDKLIDSKKLFLYTNKDIQQILSTYPKIDFKRYIDQEARIKILAEAEDKKLAEQRALEDKHRKKAEAEEKQLNEAQQAEQNYKEAQKLFDRAIELEREGKLEDARVNIENALALDRVNREYRQFADELGQRIERLNAKNDLYKSFLNKADRLIENNELEKALEEYEAAQQVFDNAEIIKKIIETKRLIKKLEDQKEELASMLTKAESLKEQLKLQQARDIVTKILLIDKANAAAQTLLTEIDQKEKEQQERENRIKSEPIIALANNFFNEENWIEAKNQYEKALVLCPNESSVIAQIKECNDQVLKQKELFKEYLFEATIKEKKGNLKDALSILISAQQIQPDNPEIRRKITEIKLKLEFDAVDTKMPPPPSEGRNTTKDDFFETSSPPINEDDFFGKKTKPKEEKEDTFLENSSTPPENAVITYCINCGAKLEKKDKFCFVCGWKKDQ